MLYESFHLVVLEFIAKMKFFWKIFDFSILFFIFDSKSNFFKFFHNFISFYVFHFWKYEKVSIYVFVQFFMENSNFIISGARALLRARRAPLTYCEKSQNVNFSLLAILSIARRARGSARAVMKCFQMDSPDNLDAFWLLDCNFSKKTQKPRQV